MSRNEGDVIAEIKMTRAAFSGTVLILEGNSDSIFWRSHIDHKNCQITIAGGKSTCLEVARKLDEENFKGHLAIVDDDYDFFLGKKYDSPNVIHSDTNDLETLIASSPAIEKTLAEHLNSNDAGECARISLGIIEVAKNMSLYFGRLRYANRLQDLNVDFNSLSPWKYISEENLELQLQSLIADFATLANKDVQSVTLWLNSTPVDPEWNIIQGHDFTCVLAIAMKKKARGSCTEKVLCSGLRLAYERAWLVATSLGSQILDWQNRQGKIVFAQT
ncbi:DUF4435 domain-containing protein [Achromobacter insolitus]|uniref:DUF4435 domain-containing protein n=1 Tax=Achromobacter insolitus TaxID=217204 RepID=UPI0009EEA304|nr:DUF4435 domain-containing protein [Achromobacter insolitus]